MISDRNSNRKRPHGRRRLAQWATLLACALGVGQSAMAQVPFNRDLIVIDPAHGGADIGAQISDHVMEKDVTMAMALRLRSLLAARGFTILLTRNGDTSLTTDQRAELANRAHAVACLVLHATASGSGVHLATSTLNATVTTDPSAPIPWDDAQAAYLSQSQRLSDQIAAAVNRSHLPLITDQAALRPLDNLMCPAIAIELAPLAAGDSTPTPVTDPSYQQRVNAAIAGALIFWRDLAQPPVMAPARGASPAGVSGGAAGAAR
ncbi:MAG TPA: N-acetylmuramoyl-L-alanine amidase [Granulicella sp.]|nr:N-acetylmuramoyl-L-alanine amidase [Granulicella sp.]